MLATATLPNLGALAVSGEGVIIVRTSSVGSANPDFTVDFSGAGPSARLELAEGVVLTARTMHDGRRWLRPGVYGASEDGEVRANARIAGGGRVRVLEKAETGCVIHLR